MFYSQSQKSNSPTNVKFSFLLIFAALVAAEDSRSNVEGQSVRSSRGVLEDVRTSVAGMVNAARNVANLHSAVERNNEYSESAEDKPIYEMIEVIPHSGSYLVNNSPGASHSLGNIPQIGPSYPSFNYYDSSPRFQPNPLPVHYPQVLTPCLPNMANCPPVPVQCHHNQCQYSPPLPVQSLPPSSYTDSRYFENVQPHSPETRSAVGRPEVVEDVLKDLPAILHRNRRLKMQ